MQRIAGPLGQAERQRLLGSKALPCVRSEALPCVGSKALPCVCANPGGSAGAEDAAERGALLDRAVACLGDGGPARWLLVARAAAALMGAGSAGADPAPDPEAAAAEARAARWWQEDAESAALQADLAKLARGEFRRLSTICKPCRKE